MANIERQIQEKIAAFVEELAALVRHAAVQSVTEAFGAAPSGAPGGRRGRGRGRPARTGTRSKGGKRAPEALKKVTEDLFTAIKAKPGQRMEQIAKGLGAKTKDLMLPTKKLLDGKKIRKKGQRRATTYFPA